MRVIDQVTTVHVEDISPEFAATWSTTPNNEPIPGVTIRLKCKEQHGVSAQLSFCGPLEELERFVIEFHEAVIDARTVIQDAPLPQAAAS